MKLKDRFEELLNSTKPKLREEIEKQNLEIDKQSEQIGKLKKNKKYKDMWKALKDKPISKKSIEEIEKEYL